MKKIYSYIIGFISILIVAFCSAGCGNKANEAEEYNCFEKEYIFSNTDSPIAEDNNVPTDQIKVLERRFLCYEGKTIVYDRLGIGEIDNQHQYHEFFLMDSDTLELTPFPVDCKNASLLVPYVSNDYLIIQELILEKDENEDSYYYNSRLLKYDINTQTLLLNTPYEKMNLLNTEGSILRAYDKDFLYMSLSRHGENSLYIYDYNFNLIYSTQSNDTLDYIFYSNPYGRCLIQKYSESNKFYQYDDEKNEIVSCDYKYKVSRSIYESIGNKIIPGDNKYDFYCYLNDHLGAEEDEKLYIKSLIGVKDGVLYKVFSYEDMGFSDDRLIIVPQGNGNYIVTHNIPDGSADYFLLNKTDKPMSSSSKEGKTIVKLACIIGDPSLSKAISLYNTKSEKYHIELVDYDKPELDISDCINTLNADIVSGNAPDAVCLYGLNKQSYIEKGLLQDLNDYFDQSEKVKKEDFWDVYEKNLTSEDGRIYSIYPEIGFVGLYSSSGIRPEELPRLNYSDESIHTNQIGNSLLCSLIQYSGDYFIDDKNNLLNKEDDFTDLLKLSKELNNGYDSNESLTFEYDTFYYPYTYFNEKDRLGGTIKCTNYGVDAPIIVPNMSNLEIGILTNAANKEGIYDFFDFIFQEENYNSCFGIINYPVLQSSWDKWENRLLSADNNNGNYNGSITEEDIKQMNEMLNNAIRRDPIPSKYLLIINEETGGYFEGQKNIEQIMKPLTSRLKIAISE